MQRQFSKSFRLNSLDAQHSGRSKYVDATMRVNLWHKECKNAIVHDGYAHKMQFGRATNIRNRMVNRINSNNSRTMSIENMLVRRLRANRILLIEAMVAETTITMKTVQIQTASTPAMLREEVKPHRRLKYFSFISMILAPCAPMEQFSELHYSMAKRQKLFAS